MFWEVLGEHQVTRVPGRLVVLCVSLSPAGFLFHDTCADALLMDAGVHRAAAFSLPPPQLLVCSPWAASFSLCAGSPGGTWQSQAMWDRALRDSSGAEPTSCGPDPGAEGSRAHHLGR